MTPITELTVLSAPKALWKEWLAAYFDGGAHDVGAHPAVVFPRANLAFGQGRVRQPLNAADNPQSAAQTSAEIRVVMLPRAETAVWHVTPAEGEHLLSSQFVVFQFQVRARRERSEDSELLADQVAQLLHALLANPEARFPLARCGIANLAPRPVESLPAAEWSLRLVHCAAQLYVPILFGDTAPAGGTVTTLAAGQNLLPFLREAPLVAGEYLGGYYRLAVAQRAVRVDLLAEAGNAVTTLELEVNGTLTGQSLTLPAGSGEVTAAAALDYPLTAGQVVRWKITAGPAAEVAAWKASLTLRLA